METKSRLNTSTALLARERIVAPIERARRANTAWLVDDGDFYVEIDDMLTESDVDLLEWLTKHGNPQRLCDGKVAFKFSLYRAAHALGQGRARIMKRILRRMKTLITVRDGDWRCTAQMFGPTLHNIRNGEYIVTLTKEFVELWEHGLLVYYGDYVDDIIPITSPVVRRLVRRTLSHQRRTESLRRVLREIRYGVDTRSDPSREEMWRRAIADITAAADYLAAVFGIEIVTLRDGQPGLRYVRDRSDRRIWFANSREPRAPRPPMPNPTLGNCEPNSREPQPNSREPRAQLSGTAA